MIGTSVYVVTHRHWLSKETVDDKFIGVFSTLEKSRDAVIALSEVPGFRDTKHGFTTHECKLGELLEPGIEMAE